MLLRYKWLQVVSIYALLCKCAAVQQPMFSIYPFRKVVSRHFIFRTFIYVYLTVVGERAGTSEIDFCACFEISCDFGCTFDISAVGKTSLV